MGDPAGVGPEIVLKAFREGRDGWFWLGDPAVLAWTGKELGLAAPLREIAAPDEAKNLPPEVLPVLPTRARVGEPAFGQADPANGPTVFESIRTACDLALAGKIDALVTPPLNKSVLHAAGIDHPGHTEMLAEFTGVKQAVMMLAGGGLRVVPATIHQSIASVPGSLTREGLRHVLTVTHEALRIDFGLESPRLSVAGLNPHAGEAGAFGREEIDLIAPLCQALRDEKGWDLRGPLPADTMFHAAARKSFDATVCMYHDQALIPLKMLAFGDAVNVTLGLPVVRTSVDHGTAYDIAGTGRADHRSLMHALALAESIAANRKNAP